GAMPDSSRWSQRRGDHRNTAQKGRTPNRGARNDVPFHDFCHPSGMGNYSLALSRWYRGAQPPATVWQPFGLQPPLVVGLQKLRCAQNPRNRAIRNPNSSLAIDRHLDILPSPLFSQRERANEKLIYASS